MTSQATAFATYVQKLAQADKSKAEELAKNYPSTDDSEKEQEKKFLLTLLACVLRENQLGLWMEGNSLYATYVEDSKQTKVKR
jgi:hypothetical protein